MSIEKQVAALISAKADPALIAKIQRFPAAPAPTLVKEPESDAKQDDAPSEPKTVRKSRKAK